jgi:hypothetical protein
MIDNTIYLPINKTVTERCVANAFGVVARSKERVWCGGALQV